MGYRFTDGSQAILVSLSHVHHCEQANLHTLLICNCKGIHINTDRCEQDRETIWINVNVTPIWRISLQIDLDNCYPDMREWGQNLGKIKC